MNVHKFLEEKLEELLAAEFSILRVIRKTQVVIEEKKAKIDLIHVQAQIEIVKEILSLINNSTK